MELCIRGIFFAFQGVDCFTIDHAAIDFILVKACMAITKLMTGINKSFEVI
jgi:hypothetical protein